MSEDPNSSADPTPSHEETPAEHIAAEQKKKNMYLRLTSSMPLVVTVIVHIVIGLGAAAVVVQQASTEKKKTFEASERMESAAVKQVEHRLQVARRGGASGGSSSPVSANRIFSTAAGGLQMPSMPDLPTMGTGGFGGFSGMGAGVGLNSSGSGMATSLGSGTGLGGRGFMSLTFLGATSQNVSKIVFVVDTSPDIMDLRKGGFRAFTIIREEIMRLVSRLPPSAQFNVVLFTNQGASANHVNTNLFKTELVPASTANKTEFFTWMSPVNTKVDTFGPQSAGSRTPWRLKPLPPDSGVEELFTPPIWARATQAALEQQPDTIFVITSSAGGSSRRADDATIARRRAEAEKVREAYLKDLAKEGLDPAKVAAARDRAGNRVWEQFREGNRKLVAAGKDPIVVTSWGRLWAADVQAELRKNGIRLTLDTTGWTRKDGSQIQAPNTHVATHEGAKFEEFMAHYARVQRALVPERPALNLFLFVGPQDRPDTAVRDLTTIARRNGGSFQLLTTARLEEIKAQAEAEAAKAR